MTCYERIRKYQKEYCKIYNQKPEVKEKNRLRQKKYREKPDVKKHMSEYAKNKYLTDETYRQICIERGRKCWMRYKDKKAYEEAKKLLDQADQYFNDVKLAELFVMDGIALDDEMKKRGIIK